MNSPRTLDRDAAVRRAGVAFRVGERLDGGAAGPDAVGRRGALSYPFASAGTPGEWAGRRGIRRTLADQRNGTLEKGTGRRSVLASAPAFDVDGARRLMHVVAVVLVGAALTARQRLLTRRPYRRVDVSQRQLRELRSR